MGNNNWQKHRLKQFHAPRIESSLVPDVDPCCSRAPINRRAPLPCLQSTGRLICNTGRTHRTIPLSFTAAHSPRPSAGEATHIYSHPGSTQSDHSTVELTADQHTKDHIPQLVAIRDQSDQEFKNHKHPQWLGKKRWIAT
jgi:hypothetical protein